jgi:hypothetical protein
MDLPRSVFDCIEKETIFHFNRFCKSVKNGDYPHIIINKNECFNNGKKIADWVTDKINEESEFTAKVYGYDKPFLYSIPNLRQGLRQYKIQVTPKCNSFFK